MIDTKEVSDFEYHAQTTEQIIEEAEKKLLGEKNQQGLMPQNPRIDINDITALNPEIISRQATINIGTIGHVAHGKSTLVRAISGVNVSFIAFNFTNCFCHFQTVRHYDEKFRNITIKLGYANAKLYKCPECPAPSCYKSFPSKKPDVVACTNKDCTQKLILIRHVSFVDCPGHDTLMATMLAGAAVMDAALLLVAGN